MTGEITELSGPSGSGKTQICLASAINVARYISLFVGLLAVSPDRDPFAIRMAEIYAMAENSRERWHSLIAVHRFPSAG